MDDVDFPTAYRAAEPDQGWPPLRDAIAAVLKPLHARIVRAAGSADPAAEPRLDVAPESWLPAGDDYCDRLMAEIRRSEPTEAVEVVDRAAYLAAIHATALEEPDTVAEARALLADADAALEKPEAERQAAWLVALADLQHRRDAVAQFGGTAA